MPLCQTRRPSQPAGKSVIADMAGIMVERAAGGGACTEADLKAAGFSPSQIERFQDDARSLAATRVRDR